MLHECSGGTLCGRGTGAKAGTGIGARKQDLATAGRVSQVLPRAPGDSTWLTGASASPSRAPSKSDNCIGRESRGRAKRPTV